MLNFKKISQIRALSESIVLTPRSTTGIKRMGVGGADHSERDDGYDPFVPKTDKDKRIKAALDRMGQEYQSGKPFSNQRRNESKHTGEGDMAKSQLRSIIANAQEVHDMLEDDDDMSEWVQNKITLSADYISTVREYMKNEVNEGHDLKMAKPSLLNRVKKTNKQNQDQRLADREKSKLAFDNMFGGGNPASSLSIRKKSTSEDVEQVNELSKDTVKSYLDKTVDPVYGMPKHGMKDRIQGIRRASARLLKK